MSELCFIIDRCLASQLVCTVGEKNAIEDRESSYLSTVNYSGTPNSGGKPAGSVLYVLYSRGGVEAGALCMHENCHPASAFNSPAH